MKNILFFFGLFLISSISLAQAPQGMNYQGVARDMQGNAISMTNISLRFTILQGSTPVYVETHAATTDTFGLYTKVIGQGTVVSGTFNTINWGSGVYSVKVEIDPGTGYQTISTTQLMSVPYALYAASAGGGSLPSGAANQTLYNSASGSNWTASSDILVNPNTNVIIANKLGIGTTPSTSFALDVVGSGKFSSGILTNAFVMPTGAGTGKVLTSDNAGNASWQTPTSGGLTSIIPGTGIITTVSGSTVTVSADNSNAIWNANKLQGIPVNGTAPLTGDILKYNGVNWTPSPFNGLPPPQIGSLLFTDASNIWAPTNPAKIYTDGTGISIGGGTPSGLLDVVNTNTASINNNLNISNSGQGYAINIQNLYTGSGAGGLNIYHKGLSAAAYISAQNNANNADILYVETTGNGNAIKGYTAAQGNGVIGYSHSNISSSSGIYGLSDVNGSAGIFNVSNPANSTAALIATTTGTTTTSYSGRFSGGAGVQIDKLQVQTSLNIPLNSNFGYVLTSNAVGDATWQPPTGGGGGTVTSITAGTGLAGGTITNSGTLSLANSGVTAGTYGSATTIPQFNVDIFGRIVSASPLAILGLLSGGTVNYVPHWTSPNALSSTSLIFDNGSAVGINNSSPNAMLDVIGSGNNATIKATSTGTGSAVLASGSGSGASIFAGNSSANGSAISASTGAGNTAAVITATAPAGGGNSGVFTGGQGLKTDNFQMTNGANNGFVLVSNATGNAAWAGSIGFSAANNSTQAIPSGPLTVLNFPNVAYNNGPGALSSNTYTTAVAGIYHIDAAVVFNAATANSSIYVYVNGSIAKEVQYTALAAGSSMAISADVNVPAGQTIDIRVILGAAATTNPLGVNNVWFDAHLIR